MIELEKLPPPDGAPFKCTVDVPKTIWPYVQRCDEKPVGMLSLEEFDRASREFHMGGRIVCQTHADRIGSYLRENQ
jgi:hypothetical protein